MDSFSVVVGRVVTADELVSFLRGSGGYVNDEATGSGGVAHGEANVYIDLQVPAHPLGMRADALSSELVFSPSRREGSVELAFKVADEAVTQWGGVIDWSGLDWLEDMYRQRAEGG
jgi:hypothetical protein